MKFIKNILVFLGLLLQVGIGFAIDSHAAIRILNRIDQFKKEEASGSNNLAVWKPSGPTREDVEAATKVTNLAAKGSREDALISAVENGDLKDVKTLIAKDVDFEARNSKSMTALMIAAKKGYFDIARALINAGANVSARDRFDWSALNHAVDNDHAETVKLLMANGAAKNHKDFSELFISAIFKGNDAMVKALIVEGDSMGRDTLKTAFSFAQGKCSAEIVNAIKELLAKNHS